VKTAFYHNVWSSIVGLSMMYVLGSMPELQMLGIILGMNTGMILLTSLHYATICKDLGVSVFLTGGGRTAPRIES
ncbi:multidrug transporter MatE, partial [Bacillus sp. RHFS18]|nr:multidrug transporter MatE [Bacillus sp. RHFS18]